MKKDDQIINETNSKQDFIDLTKQLHENKKEMFRILTQNPKIGVYKNQTHDDWDIFYKFFINFLKSQIGPRGQCAKNVRAQLIAQQQAVNQILAPFNQTAHNHIRQIYMRNKFFVPCPQYTQMIKMKDARQKLKMNLQKLMDEHSPMVLSITQGLTKKHGNDYDIKSQLIKLQQNYKIKLIQTDKLIQNLQAITETHKSYHDLMRVNKFMEPYFKQWVNADSSIGRENVKTGEAFQEKVFKKLIPYIVRREQLDQNWIYGKKKIEIFTNVNWIPKNLGEIDIALGYKDQIKDRYFIFTLIQCKSRFFDLREAFRQVSLEDQPAINKGLTFSELKEIKRVKLQVSKKKSEEGMKKKQKVKQNQTNQQKIEKQTQQIEEKPQLKPQIKPINKKFLSTKYGPAELVADHHFYIITTLPQNDFILPIQSKMKESIQKHTKNLFIQDIESEPMYLYLKQRFSQIMSPLDWINNYEQQFTDKQSNILVLH